MLGLTESKVAADTMEVLTGKKLFVPKTWKNTVSGKHKIKRSFWASLKRFSVAQDRIEIYQELVEEATKLHNANDGRGGHSVVAWRSAAYGLRKSEGCPYLADVMNNIVQNEQDLCSAGKDYFQSHIGGNALASLILCAREIQSLQEIHDNESIGLALAPLRLKTPLYVFAAMEAEYFAAHNKSERLNTSLEITDGKERAVGVLFETLLEYKQCGITEFVRRYISDGNSDEESAIRTFGRWRSGESIPDFKKVLKVARKLYKEHDDVCVVRLMFLFLLAVFSVNADKKNSAWSMGIEWGEEYGRFLDIHMADIKKGQSI